MVNKKAYDSLSPVNQAILKYGCQAAAIKATTAETSRQRAQIELDKKTRETQGLRDYLDEWQPYLRMTKTESEAERMFNTKLKQGALVIWRQSFEPMKLNDESTIPNALRARITFEDDYYKMLNWVGSLESSLPTSRVSTCRITKGAKGNDIKMDLDVEVPLASAK